MSMRWSIYSIGQRQAVEDHIRKMRKKKDEETMDMSPEGISYASSYISSSEYILSILPSMKEDLAIKVEAFGQTSVSEGVVATQVTVRVDPIGHFRTNSN